MASSLSSSSSSSVVKGVIFDMDGTLTLPGSIDFNAMYSRNNFDRNNGDILTQINRLTNEDDKKKAHSIIIEEEQKGVDRMILRDHLSLLINQLNDNNIKVAISTRNNEQALYKFLELSELNPNQFTHLLHRDSINIDGKMINKPDPRVAYHITKSWNVNYEETYFVGDSDDDIHCGISANMKTCLIRTRLVYLLSLL
jgi:HAD superfamily hydrolase (TIGR01549 family)